jgi:hypothetical protein
MIKVLSSIGPTGAADVNRRAMAPG